MKKARHAAPTSVSYMTEARKKLDDARIPVSSRKSFLSALQKFVTSDQARFSVTLSQEELTAWISTLTLVSKYLFGLYPSPEEERQRSSPQSKAVERRRASPQSKEEVPVGRFYRISSSSSEDEAPRRRRAGRQAAGDQRQTPSFINIFEEKVEVEEPAEAAGFSVDPRTGLMTVPLDEQPDERASASSEESEEERPKRKARKDRKRRVVECDSESESEEERPRRKKAKKDRKKERRHKKRVVESSDSESEYEEEEKPKRKSKKGKKDKKKRARQESSSSSESDSDS